MLIQFIIVILFFLCPFNQMVNYIDFVGTWYHSLLAELLEESNLEAKLPELQNNDVYVLKFINAMIDIKI
jgi:hypothetical protein